MENNWLKIEQEGDKVILRECSQEATGKIVIPEGVTCIDPFAFDRCIGLTSIEIPNSVISIGDGAFDDCTNLKSITIAPNNRIYDSRNNCNAIIETATNTLIRGCEETVIPDDITIIEQGAFSGCKDLREILIPESVTNIGSRAFSRCDDLVQVKLGMTSPLNIDESTFSNRTNATLYVPEGSKASYEQANVWNEFKEIIEY